MHSPLRVRHEYSNFKPITVTVVRRAINRRFHATFIENLCPSYNGSDRKKETWAKVIWR